MTNRAHRRDGKIIVDGLDFDRFASKLGKALRDDYKLVLNPGVVHDLAARSIGFQSKHDLTCQTSKLQKAYEPGSAGWLREARAQLDDAIADKQRSNALLVAIHGSNRRTRGDVAHSYIRHEDATVINASPVSNLQLETIGLSGKTIVVFDAVRRDDGSAARVVDFARAYAGKTVIALVEQGDHDLISLVNDEVDGPRGWRINYLALEDRALRWNYTGRLPEASSDEVEHTA